MAAQEVGGDVRAVFIAGDRRQITFHCGGTALVRSVSGNVHVAWVPAEAHVGETSSWAGCSGSGVRARVASGLWWREQLGRFPAAIDSVQEASLQR